MGSTWRKKHVLFLTPRTCNNTINKLKTGTDHTVSKDNDILHIMCEFYKNLHTSKQIHDHSIEHYLNATYLENTVTNDDKYKYDEFPT